MTFITRIERNKGFFSYGYDITASTLELLLHAIRGFAEEADKNDRLCILGSTYDPDSWEAIEDCWETYVVPAIEKRELAKKIQLIESDIAREESWFFNLESIKAQKEQHLESLYSHLKTLKEQQ